MYEVPRWACPWDTGRVCGMSHAGPVLGIQGAYVGCPTLGLSLGYTARMWDVPRWACPWDTGRVCGMSHAGGRPWDAWLTAYKHASPLYVLSCHVSSPVITYLLFGSRCGDAGAPSLKDVSWLT